MDAKNEDEQSVLLDVEVATPQYAKHESIDMACELFDVVLSEMHLTDGMIAGYAQNEFVEKVSETSKLMQLARYTQI